MPNSPSIVYFDATLKPNTALSPRAFLIIMALVGGMSFLAGLMFLSMGAFPVLGWFGLDALAIWYAFRRNFRNLKEETTVQVTADAIRLRHMHPDREPREIDLPTAFTRLSLAYPDRRPSELRLAHGQTAYVIGRFLTPNERKSLFSALENAIARARAERY